MANTNNTSWDITYPQDSSFVSDGAREMRVLRDAVAVRINKEHVTLATSSAGGEHKEGSAVGYYAASAPTLRPDGSTAFTSADQGRIWFDSDDSNHLQVYSGSAWEDAKVAVADSALGLDAGYIGGGLIEDSGTLNAYTDNASIELDGSGRISVKDAGIVAAMIGEALPLSTMEAGTLRLYITTFDVTGTAVAVDITPDTAIVPKFIMVAHPSGRTIWGVAGNTTAFSLWSDDGGASSSKLTWASNKVTIGTTIDTYINANSSGVHTVFLVGVKGS